MNESYTEIYTLVNDIVDHKVNLEEAAERIEMLKSLYGDDIFPGYIFEKEPKPWRKSYLKELKEMHISGACSEEFILYMAEVSDDIYAQKMRMIIGVAVTAVIILLLVLLIILL